MVSPFFETFDPTEASLLLPPPTAPLSFSSSSTSPCLFPALCLSLLDSETCLNFLDNLYLVLVLPRTPASPVCTNVFHSVARKNSVFASFPSLIHLLCPSLVCVECIRTIPLVLMNTNNIPKKEGKNLTSGCFCSDVVLACAPFYSFFFLFLRFVLIFAFFCPFIPRHVATSPCSSESLPSQMTRVSQMPSPVLHPAIVRVEEEEEEN